MSTSLADMIAEYPRLSSLTDIDQMMESLAVEMKMSLAQIVSELPEDEQELVLGGTDPDLLLYDWTFWGRASQRPPDSDDWSLFAFTGGRGSGKTRAGSEWVRKMVLKYPGCRIGLVGRTAADVRDVMINGDSGILNVGPPDERPAYYASRGELIWPNGSRAKGYSAEEPDQLRGPQFNFTWADETAAWKHQEDDSGLNAWSQVIIATRLGDSPQVFATTTPKRTPFMFELLDREKKDKGVILSHSSMMENVGNLGPKYIETMLALYGGSRLAEQELYGIMLENVEGALWSDELIGKARLIEVPGLLAKFPLRVIAVDPSVAENPKDECGIIVAGATRHKKVSQRHAALIEDMSILGAPAVWAKQVVKAYEKYQCPVVVEVNQGGALVTEAIHAINPAIPILTVHAYKGKALRAEPVTLKYDQGKVHHIGYLPELESQQTTWVPGETKKSPDRVDAMVYAVSALIIKPPKNFGGGKFKAKSFAKRTLPGVGRK